MAGWNANGTGWDLDERVQKVAMLAWDADSLSWVRASLAGGSTSADAGPQNAAFDFSSASVVYVGKSAPGVTEDAPFWRIARIVFDEAANPVSIKFAGSGAYTSRWDQRKTLAY